MKHNMLADTEKLLQDGRYDLCSIDCGKKIEGILKRILKEYLEIAPESKSRSLKVKFPPNHSINTLTLGQIAKLFQSEQILQSLIEKNDTNRNELPSIDLGMIAYIRNQAAHNKKAVELEKSDAYILYGSLLKLYKITELFDEAKEKSIVEKSLIKSQENMRATHIMEGNITGKFIPSSSEPVTVVRNKSTGKYFIYYENDATRKVLVVNPEGKPIPFVPNLFQALEEKILTDLISSNLINQSQVKEYERQKKVNKDLIDLKRQTAFPHIRKIIPKDISQRGKTIRTKKTFPRGCTVNGAHYESGNEAIDALLSMGKIEKGNVPTSSFNAHLWLNVNSSKLGFLYKRDLS